MEHPLAAIILAAGKGTRMKSDLPKVLHKVLGKTMVSRVIDQAKAVGVQKIVVVVGYKKEMVMESLKDADVTFAIQEEQLGTAHAVMQCEPFFETWDGDILILSGDVPLLTTHTLQQLIKRHIDNNADATMLTAIVENPEGYGRILRNDDNTLKDIVEEKDATPEIRQIKEINSGIYVFKKEPLFSYLKYVDNKNAQGEYYLPDVLPIMVRNNKKIYLQVADQWEEVQGINTIEELKQTEEKLKRML
ncbi:MAG: sugar phosphate nucleotidyltransferase [Candidatus Marinimicrobia bacterium]|nr:sugar phosphate nucleotidyltransferase [Candidatus Neomarinimicrobiota bacterium]MDD5581605.1 sugar phosphate nucleotidyltransferase [Candidatus Neomarinimicrobiota bacterium]